MKYEKQNFKANGVLRAEQLNHIEDGLNEILDSMDIMIDSAMDKTTKIQNGTIVSVNGNTCSATINGKRIDNIYYYGGAPQKNKQYRVFIPSGNMSQAFIITTDGVAQSSATPIALSVKENKSDFHRAWIYWINDLGYAFSDVESAAIEYAKFDLIAMGRTVQPDEPNLPLNERTVQIIKKAKELNPKLRVFHYIEADSDRSKDEAKVKYTGTEEYLGLNPDGSWIGSPAQVYQISCRPFNRTEIKNMIAGIKNHGVIDGIFFDDWGMSYDVKNVSYQMGYEAGKYKTVPGVRNKLYLDLIDMTHEAGLSVCTNGGFQSDVGDKAENGDDKWYTHFNENDVVALESCLISSNGPGEWNDGQNTIYNYITQWYETGKCKARVWSQDYLPANCSQELRNKLTAFEYTMAFASGAHYASPDVHVFDEAPEWIYSLQQYHRDITKNTDLRYTVKCGANTLTVRKPVTNHAIATDTLADKVEYVYNDIIINNPNLTAPEVSAKFAPTINDLEKTLTVMNGDTKRNAISFVRLYIDDWTEKPGLDAYTNYLKWIATFGASGSTHASFSMDKNQNGTYDVTLTYNNWGQEPSQNLLLDFWDTNHLKDIPSGDVSLLADDIIWDLTSSDGSYDIKSATSARPKGNGQWPRPGANIYIDGVNGLYARSTFQNIECFAVTVGENDINHDRLRMYVWVAPPEGITLSGTVTLKGLRVIDPNELNLDIVKRWYTNIFPSSFSVNGGIEITSNGTTEKRTEKLPNITGRVWDKNHGSGYQTFSEDQVLDLRGHTLEFGYDTMTLRGTEDDYGMDYLRWEIEVTTPGSTTLYEIEHSESKMSVFGEELHCIKFQIPDTATGIRVLMLCQNAVTNGSYIDINGCYLYDLDEEDLAIRGVTPTTSTMAVARVTDAEEKNDPATLNNAFYVSDLGEAWMRDINGNRISIEGGLYVGAKQAGYKGTPREFGAALYKLISG